MVPYSSYSEYEEMLEDLITSYEGMVLRAVNPQTVMGWCRLHGGVGPLLEMTWLQDGDELFLKFVKGVGSDWCDTMSTMVVHALSTAVRVMIETRGMMDGMGMDGGYEDQAQMRGLLKREIRRAIADRDRGPNNMCLFENRNFQKIWRSECGEDGLFDCDKIPIAQWQAMQLGFCMINHERLGGSGAGKALSYDVIKLILLRVIE